MAQSMSNQPPTNLTSHLKGAQFPASKNDLVQVARGNSADRTVVEALEKLPGEKYASIAEVMKAFGKEEPEHDLRRPRPRH